MFNIITHKHLSHLGMQCVPSTAVVLVVSLFHSAISRVQLVPTKQRQRASQKQKLEEVKSKGLAYS